MSDDNDSNGRTAIDRLGRVAIYLIAIVGGWLLHSQVDLWAQNQPALTIAGAVVVAAIPVGFYFLQERGDGSQDRSWIPPVVIVFAFVVFGLQSGLAARDNYLRYYCEYGAQSQAQLDECMSNVTTDDINRLDTQAARFGRGENSDCLADSGPYCADAAKWNGFTPDDAPGQFSP